jgi:hypothetical protein
MGIDVYMRWKGQSKDEKEAQFTGFSTVHGHIGYLREAYHGGPYATTALCGEDGGIVSASELKARLPEALKACEIRERTIYKGDDAAVAQRQKAFIDFVALAEQKEKETGEPVEIVVSG